MGQMGEELHKVILVTGASHGIGRACANRLAIEGHHVYGTSRHPENVNELKNLNILAMDVNSDESVDALINEVVGLEGRIDVVINNAGFGIAGSIEDTSVEEAKSIFETNFFGLLRVCRAVVPKMREMGQGKIINISSLGGRIGLPFQGLYSATKFAVEGLSEALRMEVRQFGIAVTVIEPGDMRTNFTDNRRYTKGSMDSSPYAVALKRTMNVVETDERQGSSPEQVADLVARLVSRRSLKVRYSTGSLLQRGAAFVKQIVPGKFFEWALMKYYKVV
jgi:short-subunit dehydrogenase